LVGGGCEKFEIFFPCRRRCGYVYCLSAAARKFKFFSSVGGAAARKFTNEKLFPK
jgi:hypothetical protein